MKLSYQMTSSKEIERGVLSESTNYSEEIITVHF